MINLYIPPEIHLAKHIQSGKKLDIGNAKPCSNCEGFGYMDPKYYIKNIMEENPLVLLCQCCNGSGRSPE